MRYLTPSILTAITAGMWWYNGSNGDSKLVFPLIDLLVPNLASDPLKMAELSLKLAVGISGIAWGLAMLGHVREIRARRASAALQTDDAE